MGNRLLPLSRKQRLHSEPSHVHHGEHVCRAIISTLFAGYIADRWMNSEKLMGICHILGAGLLFAMTQVTSPDQYWLLFAISFCYSLIFNPTLSVINSLTFRNVPDGERDFPGFVFWEPLDGSVLDF